MYVMITKFLGNNYENIIGITYEYHKNNIRITYESHKIII